MLPRQKTLRIQSPPKGLWDFLASNPWTLDFLGVNLDSDPDLEILESIRNNVVQHLEDGPLLVINPGATWCNQPTEASKSHLVDLVQDPNFDDEKTGWDTPNSPGHMTTRPTFLCFKLLRCVCYWERCSMEFHAFRLGLAVENKNN